LIDDVPPEAKIIEDNKNTNEIFEDIKKILNKVIYLKLLLFYEVLNVNINKYIFKI